MSFEYKKISKTQITIQLTLLPIVGVIYFMNFTCLYLCVCLYVCMYVFIIQFILYSPISQICLKRALQSVHTYIYIQSTCIYTRINIHIYMYIYTCVYIYTCTLYIYISIYISVSYFKPIFLKYAPSCIFYFYIHINHVKYDIKYTIIHPFTTCLSLSACISIYNI